MATTVITDALVILSTDQHGRVETSDAIAIDGNRIVAVGDVAHRANQTEASKTTCHSENVHLFDMDHMSFSSRHPS